MKIAFFGLPIAAALLANDGHEVVYAAACRRAPGLRRLGSRVAPGRTFLRPDLAKAEHVQRLRSSDPQLIVSFFWTTKLPKAVLAIAPAIGVHPSLLPRHRGADPYFWAIDSADPVTGVTVHRLELDYDTGAIVGQRELPIGPDWNAWRLARALDRPGLALLRDVVRAYASGRAPPETAQDERAATLALEPSDEELAISWSWPATRIERRVRAAAPWPGAWTELGTDIVTLVRVRPTTHFPRALQPAEAAVRADGMAVIRAGDDAVELLEGRDEAEGDLSARDLAARVLALQALQA